MENKNKTNVMRLLEQNNIKYIPYYLNIGKTVPSGINAAELLGKNANQVFKTLVVVGSSNEHYVFDIPSDCTLNLKKAAKAVGEKSIQMLPQKQLFPITGYVHGGCSPIGMKKKLLTVIDETCILYDSIIISAGKIGCHIEISTNDLSSFIDAKIDDVIDEE